MKKASIDPNLLGHHNWDEAGWMMPPSESPGEVTARHTGFEVAGATMGWLRWFSSQTSISDIDELSDLSEDEDNDEDDGVENVNPRDDDTERCSYCWSLMVGSY
eukprot:scaffold3955_cov160-Cylindrotheca_fusiformis.AAC.12